MGVARERGGRDACPLHCPRRRAGASDHQSNDPALDHVDWAGLPVNLDMVFSQQQLDRVYVQYLMRRRGNQLWGWSQDGGPVCACDLAADGRRAPDSAQSMSGR